MAAQLRLSTRSIGVTWGWAGWLLAGGAAWSLARHHARREGGPAAAALLAAAVFDIAAHAPGTLGVLAGAASAAAAIAGCAALARIAPALLETLDVPQQDAPRRPRSGAGWMLPVRAAVGAVIAAGVLYGAATSTGRQVPAVAAQLAFGYVPIALCIGGWEVWRLTLARRPRPRRLPVLLALGLVTPATLLLVTETVAALSPASARIALAPQLAVFPRLAILCALLFALLRLLDAARVRARADAAVADVTGADVADVGGHGPAREPVV